MEKRAVYPGSFDPITNGHVDIIERSTKIFDTLIIGVLDNPKKQPLFSTNERVSMIKKIFAGNPKVEVASFHGLLIEFAEKKQAEILIKGLRAISDFEYEFQMALMNRKLNPDIETFFLMPNLHYSFLSSGLVKEIFNLGGCIKGLVPELVEIKLRGKFSECPEN
ncbi:MAG: pantetheine-phosphate adenylyltransferase [Candidatus Aminicenantes bacterium]|nr:pantetheine-phosphate adenylyltransferase [Candidatus Aminicenantes bacterium]